LNSYPAHGSCQPSPDAHFWLLILRLTSATTFHGVSLS
jgi:hypothetical protein